MRNKKYFHLFVSALLILPAFGFITIDAQTTPLADTTFVCNADSVQLDAGPVFINYLWWETAETSQTIWVTDAGWYHVSCDTTELQPPVIDSTWVVFLNTRIVQGDTVIRYTYPIHLCVEPDTLQYIWTSNNPDYFIEYDTAACIEIIPELAPTTFYVSIINSLNFITCVDSVTVMPHLSLLPNTTWVCNSASVLLDAGPGFINYFWWETAEQTQTIWVQDTGWYHVSCDTADLQPPIIDSSWVYFQKAGIVQNDTVTCYTHSLDLCVEPDTLKYLWTASDPNYFIEDSTAACIEVTPELDTTTFCVSITDSLNISTCIDSITVWLHPRMRFEKVTQINTGCAGTCKGQLEVIVSGGKPPYRYFWVPAHEQDDSIAFGLCEEKYTFRVFDEFICRRDTVLPVEVFDMPEVEIFSDPNTADIYIQNPVVTFSFENNSIDSIHVNDWNWNFGDSTYSVEANPVKVYDQVREYDVWLKYTTNDECIDSVTTRINVKQEDLTIPNIFTPNYTYDYNPTFLIKNLEYYMSNELSVYNRYGKRVYHKKDYQSDWDGGNLRDGAYFYVLKAVGYFGTDTYTGSVTIYRGNE